MESPRTLTTPAWSSRDQRIHNSLAWFLTALLLAGSYAVLKRAPVPKARTESVHYEQIDWKRFSPKPVVKRSVPAEPSPTARRHEKADYRVPKRVERIDLTKITGFFGPEPEPEASYVKAPLDPQALRPSDPHERSSLKASELSSLLIQPASPEAGELEIAHTGPETVGSRPDLPQVKLEKGSELQAVEMEYGISDTGLKTQRPATVEGQIPTIPIIDANALQAGYEDLSPLFRELVEWMKSHPTKFPPVVRAFLEVRPGDLGSRAEFRIDERSFELFLMCRENERELRICLVEGDSSTLLIDRGFKERSNYLRTGALGRSSSGQIAYLATSQKAPSNTQTVEFYRLFLSWWRQQKDE
jgi:hypothetical protein